LGPRAGDHYIVHDGLAEGERVVVNGNFKIDSAMQIMAEPSMMSPDGGAVPSGHHHHGSDAPHAAAKPGAPPTQADVDEEDGGALQVPALFTSELDPVVSAYLEIQQALSHDEHEKAQAAAKDLDTQLKGVNMKLLNGHAHHAWMKEAAGLATAVTRLSDSADITKAREAFALLSESMIVVAKRFGPGHQVVHRIHCPMAFDNRGADWLQAAKQTENPYFGSAMFRCGALKETIGVTAEQADQGGASDE
jgi:Cu(I)/Ag(I) efflux system membrane fusion protein